MKWRESWENKDEALFGISKDLEKFKEIINNYEVTKGALKKKIISLSQAKTIADKKLQEINI